VADANLLSREAALAELEEERGRSTVVAAVAGDKVAEAAASQAGPAVPALPSSTGSGFIVFECV
jgi:hypothetical protein